MNQVLHHVRMMQVGTAIVQAKRNHAYVVHVHEPLWASLHHV